MTFGPIQFGGLASGLDTAAIINAILDVERIPIFQLGVQKDEEQEKLNLLGTFEGHLQSLRDKAEELSTRAGFLAFDVTPSEEGVANFTVTGAPQSGSHDLSVVSLASAHRLAFDGVADPTADLGGGTLDITYDGTQNFSVTLTAGMDLEDLADEINTLTDGEVTASVVNTGASTPNYQLVLTGGDTGEAQTITINSNSISGLTGGSTLTAASNAEIVLDGLTIERETNTFSDVLDGLSIDVLAADAGKTISFTTAVDDETIVSNLQGFVDAYNEVVDFIGNQNTFTEDDGAGGALFGDSILRTVGSGISAPLFNLDVTAFINDTTGFASLAQVGIDLDSSGRLSLDEDQVRSKLDEDVDLFADLFVDDDGFDNGGATENTEAYYIDTTADTGLFDDLFRNIDQLVEDRVLSDGTTLDGLFKNKRSTHDANIGRIDDQIEDMERRLEQVEADLVARFSALEELMAGLQSQLNFLNSNSPGAAQA